MRDIRESVAAAVLASGLLLSGAAAADGVALRADEWCPYNCAPGSDRPGYAVEIAREVFAKAGHEIDYGTLNWARSIEDARAGRYAGVIAAIPEDAPDFVFPREPIGISAAGFAARKAAPFRYDGLHSFEGKVVGAVAGYAFGGDLDVFVHANEGDRSKIQFTSGDDALAKGLRKLAEGRVDVVVDDANVLAHAIAELGLGDRLAVTDRKKDPPLVYIAFSPAVARSDEYARLLDAGIAELRASGRLQAILARYGVEDWR